MAVTLSWADLVSIAGTEGQDILGIITPFLPALIRAGDEVYVGFVENLGKGDIDGVTELMYPHMTHEERQTLETVTFQNLVEATKAQADNATLMKKIAFEIAIGLITRIASGGLL